MAYVESGELRLIFDEEVLPESCGTGLGQSMNVPVVEQIVGIGVQTVGGKKIIHFTSVLANL